MHRDEEGPWCSRAHDLCPIPRHAKASHTRPDSRVRRFGEMGCQDWLCVGVRAATKARALGGAEREGWVLVIHWLLQAPQANVHLKRAYLHPLDLPSQTTRASITHRPPATSLFSGASQIWRWPPGPHIRSHPGLRRKEDDA